MSEYDNASQQGYNGLGPERHDIEYMCRYNIGVNNRRNEEDARAQRAAYHRTATADWPAWQEQASPGGGGGGGGGGGSSSSGGDDGALLLLFVAGGAAVLVACAVVAAHWKLLLTTAVIGLLLLGALHGYDALVMRRGWRRPRDAARDAVADFVSWVVTLPGAAMRRARRLHCIAAPRLQRWSERASDAAARLRHGIVVFDSRPRRMRWAALRPLADTWLKSLLHLRAFALERFAAVLRSRAVN